MESLFNGLVVLVFVLLVVATLVARFELIPQDPEPQLDEPDFKGRAGNTTLFVYIPGLSGGRYWSDLRSELCDHGDTLGLGYPNPLWSNADPVRVAEALAGTIEGRFQAGSYDRVVLIGQSMGALLAKRTFLEGEKHGQGWSEKVSRVVLLAGLNRGWDISGQKPSDMGSSTWLSIWAGSWAARLLGFGRLALSTETGSPFVANLRIDWLDRMRSSTAPIEVVQLLGDIDDLVSADDNKDLQAIPGRSFAWIKVRGTGHGNIVDFGDSTELGSLNLTLGDYRREKFELATLEDFSEIQLQSEVQPFEPDMDVTHLVFVVHGIRDLGEWAAGFEQELRKQFRTDRPESKEKIQVESIRYGYFGMGPFLLRPVRQKYVKWFMDEYTEARALYPNARQVHFVGHSNGTYLLAAALKRYDALQVERIVFGGSVVRQDYGWSQFAQRPRLRVRNYVAVDDWVVALFPRFFEPAPVAALFRNDLGSAGFNGFKSESPRVQNIRGLTGGHAAFLGRIEEIADFVLHGNDAVNPEPGPGSTDNWLVAITSRISKWGADWGAWTLVWPLLAALILFVGWHVVTAAPEPRWPFTVAYVVLLLLILRNV